MAKAKPAEMDMVFNGYVEEGDEVYHEIVLWDGVKYTIELEADDEDTDLDLYITDDEGRILYQDEEEDAGAAAWFKPGDHAVYMIFVKSAAGDTEYTISITEE